MHSLKGEMRKGGGGIKSKQFSDISKIIIWWVTRE